MSSVATSQPVAAATALDIRPVGGRLGAEIGGVRLSGELPQATVEAIRQALWKHKVLFFRDQQHVDDVVHQAFTERLGPLWVTATMSDPKAFYDLDADLPGGRASDWHTDSTFVVDPPTISVLRALRLPPRGGDTAWADTAAGYRDLPDEFQALAAKLWARHTSKLDLAAAMPAATPAQLRALDEMTPGRQAIAHHPLVFVHPQTGERCLLIRPRILGYAPALSDQVIRILQDHVTSIHNTVRWRWREGDIAVWDNLATQHLGVNDYGDLPRRMRRLTVQGAPLTAVDGRRSVEAHRPGQWS